MGHRFMNKTNRTSFTKKTQYFARRNTQKAFWLKLLFKTAVGLILIPFPEYSVQTGHISLYQIHEFHPNKRINFFARWKALRVNLFSNLQSELLFLTLLLIYCHVFLKNSQFTTQNKNFTVRTWWLFQVIWGGCEIWELLEKASEIGASKIKSPIGSLYQKYVYSSFMVKMRINFGSFGLFWFNLG